MSCTSVTPDYAMFDERWLRGLTEAQLRDETAKRAVQVATSFRRVMDGLTPVYVHDWHKGDLDRAQEECERREMAEAFRAACKREDVS